MSTKQKTYTKEYKLGAAKLVEGLRLGGEPEAAPYGALSGNQAGALTGYSTSDS